MPRSSMMSSGYGGEDDHPLLSSAVDGGVGDLLDEDVGLAVEDPVTLLDGARDRWPGRGGSCRCRAGRGRARPRGVDTKWPPRGRR